MLAHHSSFNKLPDHQQVFDFHAAAVVVVAPLPCVEVVVHVVIAAAAVGPYKSTRGAPPQRNSSRSSSQSVSQFVRNFNAAMTCPFVSRLPSAFLKNYTSALVNQYVDQCPFLMKRGISSSSTINEVHARYPILDEKPATFEGKIQIYHCISTLIKLRLSRLQV